MLNFGMCFTFIVIRGHFDLQNPWPISVFWTHTGPWSRAPQNGGVRWDEEDNRLHSVWSSRHRANEMNLDEPSLVCSAQPLLLLRLPFPPPPRPLPPVLKRAQLPSLLALSLHPARWRGSWPGYRSVRWGAQTTSTPGCRRRVLSRYWEHSRTYSTCLWGWRRCLNSGRPPAMFQCRRSHFTALSMKACGTDLTLVAGSDPRPVAGCQGACRTEG